MPGASVWSISASARGWRGRDRRHGRRSLVGTERDLRVGSAEQPRAQRGEPVERLAAGLGQQAAGRLDPSRVVQTRAHSIGLHPARF